jgi:FAD/FMN-containing dehydrogenase
MQFVCNAGTSFLIEDVACPVDKLADMTTDLVEMFEKYGYKDASCFGHALEGNLHLVFSQVCNPASPQFTVQVLFNALHAHHIHCSFVPRARMRW